MTADKFEPLELNHVVLPIELSQDTTTRSQRKQPLGWNSGRSRSQPNQTQIAFTSTSKSIILPWCENYDLPSRKGDPLSLLNCATVLDGICTKTDWLLCQTSVSMKNYNTLNLEVLFLPTYLSTNLPFHFATFLFNIRVYGMTDIQPHYYQTPHPTSRLLFVSWEKPFVKNCHTVWRNKEGLVFTCSCAETAKKLHKWKSNQSKSRKNWKFWIEKKETHIYVLIKII